jgi:hypothetical protein
MLQGRADPAMLALRRVFALDQAWPDAWMLLGEVYLHLLPGIALDSTALRVVPPPTEWPLERWAADAFARAVALDRDFTPPLTHLAELAARRADRRELTRWTEALHGAQADSLVLATLALQRGCLERAPAQPDWPREVRRSARAVYRAAITLQGAQTPGPRTCAREAFRALLAADPGDNDEDWGALVGLFGLLVAEGRAETGLALVDSAVGQGLSPALGLYALAAAAGVDPGHRADAFIAQLDAAMTSRPAPSLWLLALWSARSGDTARLRRLDSRFTARMDSAVATRLDSLLGRATAAYLALARHDTVEALRRFGALAPSAPTTVIQTSLWEPLAPERLTHARLLLARGDAAAAHRLATVLEQPGFMILPLFQRAALAIRDSAARALADARLVQLAATRLRVLSSEP